MPTQNPSDKTLWQRVKNDDVDAFKTLYEQYIDDLLMFGRRFTSNHDLVQDAIQNLFTHLWDKRSKVTPPNHTKAYLLRSMRNNLLRDAKMEQKLSSLDPEQQLPDRSIIATPTFEHDQLDRMKVAIENLSIREREVIHLKYYQGVRNTEISEIMGITSQSVANLMQRALKQIRENLKGQG